MPTSSVHRRTRRLNQSRIDPQAIHARTGYMPGEFGLYERMHVRAYLEAFAAFRAGAGRARIEPLAERLDLDLGRPIHELSHGNKQKVGMVQAFMHEPELLVLDEPTQGLDPLIQQTFYALIDEVRARGGTLFLSSHILPEVERVCDRVGIIREGRLLTVDDVGDLKAKALRSVIFHFASPVDASVFTPLPSVVAVDPRGDAIALTVRGELDEVVKEAARHTVVNVETREPSLEEIFLRAYRDGGAPWARCSASRCALAPRRDRLGSDSPPSPRCARRSTSVRESASGSRMPASAGGIPTQSAPPWRCHAGGCSRGGADRSSCTRRRGQAHDRRRGGVAFARPAARDPTHAHAGRARQGGRPAGRDMRAIGVPIQIVVVVGRPFD
jgi:ABC-2 type transport system ATP-binding protein